MHRARTCTRTRPIRVRTRSTKNPLAKSSKWFKTNWRSRATPTNLSWFPIHSSNSKIRSKPRDSQHVLHRNYCKISARPPHRKKATALRDTTTKTSSSKLWLRALFRSKAAVEVAEAAQACRNLTWLDAVRSWGSSSESRREKVHKSYISYLHKYQWTRTLELCSDFRLETALKWIHRNSNRIQASTISNQISEKSLRGSIWPPRLFMT